MSETSDLQQLGRIIAASDDHSTPMLIHRPPLQRPGFSLKARESDSLSLKRIFDQKMNAIPCDQPQEPSPHLNVNVDLQLAPSGLRQRKELPLAQERWAMDDKVKLIAGASSNASSFSSDKGQPEDALHQIRRPLHHHQAGMETTSTISYHSTVGKTPTRAQLTIFYGGKVYAYDDVPADKAHAIMLLAAGSGERSRALMGTHEHNHVTVVSTSAARPRTPPSSFSPDLPRQQLINRSQAELPFARKASLTRFLEKRKERRVDAKAAPVSPSASSLNEASEHRSSPPKKRFCTRPNSPIQPEHVDQ